MKKIALLSSITLLALTIPFSSSGYAAEETTDSNGNVKLPDWVWSVPGKIDPENPDWDNLPSSKADIVIDNTNPDDSGDSPTPYIVKPIIHGTAQTYLLKDGLMWDATSATAVDDVVFEFEVVGNIYKKAKGATGLTLMATDYDHDGLGKGVVIAQTETKTGSVGTKFVAEGIHRVSTVLIESTVVTTEEEEVK